MGTGDWRRQRDRGGGQRRQRAPAKKVAYTTRCTPIATLPYLRKSSFTRLPLGAAGGDGAGDDITNEPGASNAGSRLALVKFPVFCLLPMLLNIT